LNLYTIGFTQKSAERFFTLLRDNGVRRLVDTRLNPGGQLSGFAKGSDLAWFLTELIGCEYIHLPQLSPTSEILHDYRKDRDWERWTAPPSRAPRAACSAQRPRRNTATADSSPSDWPQPGQARR
jgi:hypothetical protein